MQQAHQGLIVVHVITGVPTCRNQSYRVGLEELFAQELTACGRYRNRLDKDFDVAYLQELAAKHPTGLS